MATASEATKQMPREARSRRQARESRYGRAVAPVVEAASTILSSPVLSCPVQCAVAPILSCPALPCPIEPWVLSCPVLSYATLSYAALSSPVRFCPALSCPVISCPALAGPGRLCQGWCESPAAKGVLTPSVSLFRVVIFFPPAVASENHASLHLAVHSSSPTCTRSVMAHAARAQTDVCVCVCLRVPESDRCNARGWNSCCSCKKKLSQSTGGSGNECPAHPSVTRGVRVCLPVARKRI